MAVDFWGRVRGLWQRISPLGDRPKVDYEALITELSRAADEYRKKIGQTTLVPCDYLVSLSPRDMDDWEEGGLADLLVQELQRALAEYIRSRGYRVNGPVTVRLVEDQRLDYGYVGLTPRFAPFDSEKPDAGGETVVWPPQGDAIASLEVLAGAQKGEVIPITRLPATMGRLTESNHPEIGLQDEGNGVSRKHALVEQDKGGFLITDLGSLNGTFLNGVQLQPNVRSPLPPDATVSLGSDIVVLAFRVGERSTVRGWQF